jgi:hypothetical protein
LTPDKLFAACADLTPLFPNGVSFEGLNLVIQFLAVLSPDLQEALQTGSTCSTPNLSALTCRSSQLLAALYSLCIAAVCQFALILAQEKLISKTVLRKMNGQSFCVAAVAALHCASSRSVWSRSRETIVVKTEAKG